jgi:hypothetical protein
LSDGSRAVSPRAVDDTPSRSRTLNMVEPHVLDTARPLLLVPADAGETKNAVAIAAVAIPISSAPRRIETPLM